MSREERGSSRSYRVQRFNTCLFGTCDDSMLAKCVFSPVMCALCSSIHWMFDLCVFCAAFFRRISTHFLTSFLFSASSQGTGCEGRLSQQTMRDGPLRWQLAQTSLLCLSDFFMFLLCVQNFSRDCIKDRKKREGST